MKKSVIILFITIIGCNTSNRSFVNHKCIAVHYIGSDEVDYIIKADNNFGKLIVDSMVYDSLGKWYYCEDVITMGYDPFPIGDTLPGATGHIYGADYRYSGKWPKEGVDYGEPENVVVIDTAGMVDWGGEVIEIRYKGKTYYPPFIEPITDTIDLGVIYFEDGKYFREFSYKGKTFLKEYPSQDWSESTEGGGSYGFDSWPPKDSTQKDDTELTAIGEEVMIGQSSKDTTAIHNVCLLGLDKSCPPKVGPHVIYHSDTTKHATLIPDNKNSIDSLIKINP